MGLEAILERKREAEEKIAALRKELKDTGGKCVCDLLAPVFEQFPDVKAVCWRQYTPYFNDGDACVFSSQHDYAEAVTHEDLDDYEFEDDLDNKDASGLAQKLLGDLTDDDMEALFGDHVEVRVFPDRVETEDYDHD